MKTLSSILEVNEPLLYEQYYNSVFKKLNIYNRNIKFINEGYTKLPTHITFTKEEQQAASEMLFALQFNYLENYFDETYNNSINEGVIDDLKTKFKDAINNGKDAIETFIKELIDKIPDSVKEAYQKLGELAKKGIDNAKSLFITLYKIFMSIGDTLSEGLEKLGIYRKTIINEIDESEFIDNIPDELITGDEKKKKVSKFLISRVYEGLNNKDAVQSLNINASSKSDGVNEGKLGKIAAIGGLAVLSQFSLLPVVLIASGYLTYKTLKFIGPKLSDKLEPWLLSDKSKEFVQKLYDNPISRYGLGLHKNLKSNEELKGLQKFFSIAKSILINFIISMLISTFVGLFISSLFSGALGPVGVSILVSSILASKNIMSTIFNRILNFKKELTIKDKKTNKEFKVTAHFFDVLTLISILASIMSVIMQIPAVKEWFERVWNKLLCTNISTNAPAKIRPDKLSFYDGHYVENFDENAPVFNLEDGRTLILDADSQRYFSVDRKTVTPVPLSELLEISKTNSNIKLPDGLSLFKNYEGLDNIKSWTILMGNNMSDATADYINNVHDFSDAHFLFSIAELNDGKKVLAVSLYLNKLSKEGIRTVLNSNGKVSFIDVTDSPEVQGIFRYIGQSSQTLEHDGLHKIWEAVCKLFMKKLKTDIRQFKIK